MKTLVSAYQCDPNRGSEYMTGWRWSESHARLGHEVVCLTSRWPDSDRTGIDRRIQELGLDNLTVEFVDLPGWAQRRAPDSGTLWVYARYLLWMRCMLKRARQLDAEIDFDLLHHASWGSLQFGSPLWRLGKPVLFGPVGGGQFSPPELKRYYEGRWRQEQLRRLTSELLMRFSPDYKPMLRHADRVLVVNPETHRLASKHSDAVEQIIDMPLSDEAVDRPPPERNQPADAGEPPELRLLWVGRLMPRKGLSLVLDALGAAKEVRFRLTILGGGELEPQVPEWIARNGLEDRVDFRGMVPFDEVQQAYRSHDALFFTTLRDSSANQFVEAMTNAMPVITLDMHGGALIVPDDAGIKVPVTTADETVAALANAVRRLAGDAELRRRMGEAGYRWIREEVHPASSRLLPEYLASFSAGKDSDATSELVESTPVAR